MLNTLYILKSGLATTTAALEAGKGRQFI